MNNLLFGIESIIKNTVDEYIKLISQKYENIDTEELINLWDIACKSNLQNVLEKKIVEKNEKKIVEKNEKKIVEKNEKKIVEKNEKSNLNGSCPYVFSKGENKGNICGSKPKTGAEFCSKHQKFEGVGQTEKKKLPKAKSISSASSVASVASSVSKKKSPVKKPIEKILRLNKEIDKFWDEDTQLVFKSRDERIVIGSYRDEKLNDLTDDDILLCQQFGFKYEELKNSVEIDDEENENDEEEIITKKSTKNDNKELNITKKSEKEHKNINKEKDIKILNNEKSRKEESKKVDKDFKKLNIISENKSKIEEPKKSIINEINKANNINIKDIESVLNELQVGNDDDDDEEEYEEIIEEDMEEVLDEDY